MTKKDFIALADHIKKEKQFYSYNTLLSLCTFLGSQNKRFMLTRWMNYIHGVCGPNGGKINARRKLQGPN